MRTGDLIGDDKHILVVAPQICLSRHACKSQLIAAHMCTAWADASHVHRAALEALALIFMTIYLTHVFVTSEQLTARVPAQ
jgi:hypothetical protein